MARVYDSSGYSEPQLRERFEAAVVATRSTWEKFELGSPELNAYIKGLADGLNFDE